MKEILEFLSEKGREIFQRIFEAEEKEIEIKDPLVIEKYPEFQRQKVIYLKNKVLNREAVLNLARKKRPQPQKKENLDLEIADPFCEAKEKTPFDELGRLENENAITSSNLSKMADYHSLVIFKKHNFENLNFEDFKSAFNLAEEWFKKIKNLDPKINTQILIWNYHYRSGASILHPHFQLLSFYHLPLPLEELNLKLENYQRNFSSNYFDDYFLLASELKIGKEKNDLKIFVDLVPYKEKGIIIYGEINKMNLNFLWEIIQKLKNSGTESFNFFYVYYSPLIKNFGYFVDRGEVSKVNSDFGALEIFLMPVISISPLELGKLLFE